MRILILCTGNSRRSQMAPFLLCLAYSCMALYQLQNSNLQSLDYGCINSC